MVMCFKLGNLSNYLYCFLWLTNTLLPRTVWSLGTLCFKMASHTLHPSSLYSLTQFIFTPQHTSQRCVLPVYFPVGFTTMTSINPPDWKLANCTFGHLAPWHTLLLNTLCYQEHFAPWNTLLPGKHCFLEHIGSWNNLIPGTLCSAKHFAPLE